MKEPKEHKAGKPEHKPEYTGPDHAEHDKGVAVLRSHLPPGVGELVTQRALLLGQRIERLAALAEASADFAAAEHQAADVDTQIAEIEQQILTLLGTDP